MGQKHYLVIGIIAILGILIISGCVPQTKTSDTTTRLNSQTNTCGELAQTLDKKIIGTNPIIGGFEGIVGGTIIKISEPRYYAPSDEEQSKVTYTITLKGINKMGDLFLRTSSGFTLPYEVGKFYKFDLKNKDQFSMQLSGAFMDPELNALEHLPECD